MPKQPSRKQREPWGRVRKLPSGRLQASYTGPDLNVHNATSTFETLMDARAWLQSERTAIDAGRWVHPSHRNAVRAANTLGAYGDAWLTARELKPRTRREYRSLLDHKIIPTLGDLDLAAVTPAVVRSWYATLDPDKPTRRAHAYSLLRTIMASAVDEDLIDIANPCRIKGAGQSKRQHKIKPATLAELEAIITRLPDRYGLMAMLAAWCALRFGELTELRRRDIELTTVRTDDGTELPTGVIAVTRGVTWVDGQPIVGKPKSDAGERDVTIPPHLIPMVKAHLDEHAATGRDGLIFPSGRLGIQVRSQTFGKTYHKARTAAGRPDLRFHDLRHTGAVLAAQTGATLAELMERLGHSTPAMAIRYQHVAEGRSAEIARLLSERVTAADHG